MKPRWTMFLRPLWIVIKQLVRKPVTVMYPQQQRPGTARFRGGTFALTTDPETGQENCIGCRLCEMICPSRIIKVTLDRRDGRGYAGIFTLEYEACMQCELCVQVCPTDAIVMSQATGAPVTSRAQLMLDKEQLLQNGRAMPVAWAAGLKLQAMHGKKVAAPAATTTPAPASDPSASAQTKEPT